MTHSQPNNSIEGIAIIGMSGRFPGAKDLSQFWQNLRNGVESVSFFSDRELEEAGVDPLLLQNPQYIKAGAVLENAALFDASFFDFNPREADVIDPQQRVFLECAWEAFEDAGYVPSEYDGLAGVYAGCSMNTYLLNNLWPNRSMIERLGGFQAMIGNQNDFLATRVSYKLDLSGPSIDIQSGCSTSLTAVQIACQSLLSYQCDMALAGGVSIGAPLKRGYLYKKGMILSPDGHCRAFDAEAQGTVFGDGVGIVVLKRLAEAIEDRDHIYAVIKGAAINNDGASKVGFTAPSIDGQSEVIAMAHALAEIDAETISYVETHGTGTPLGDPIEVAALTQAFQASTDKKGFCALGSLKTNIGHLDAAAGVASLIKTVLALKHKQIPPSLHFKEPNPKLNLPESPFHVNSKLTEWKSGKTPRRAGVSCFGIGGTNVHLILEEAPEAKDSPTSRPWHLLVLSAKTESALSSATKKMVDHFKHYPNINIADAAYTSQLGRKAFNHRRMVVCRDIDDGMKALDTLNPRLVITNKVEREKRPIAFMFTGQGSQYLDMGLELYESEQTFRDHVNLCADILKGYSGIDLCQYIYPRLEDVGEAAQRLNQTSIAQPALFVMEYSLGKLWMEWGISPQAMIGHSIGEYVAACLSGVISLEEALGLVVERSRLMQAQPGGTMLAVSLPESEILPLLNESLSLAAVNGSSLCVVAGSDESIDGLESILSAQSVDCRRLHTSHAFHSEMMSPVVAPFKDHVKSVRLNPPQIPFISNVTGTWISDDEATDPGYWAKHLRRTVRFSEGLHQLLQDTDLILLEVGPGRTLCSLAELHPDKCNSQVVLPSLRHPHDQKSDTAFILNTLGRLWLEGIKANWSGLYSREQRHRILLPTYPFEGRHHWIDPSPSLETGEEPRQYEEKTSSEFLDSLPVHKGEKIIDLFEGPRDETEEEISNIWKELLGIDKVGRQDNFFELGGHSLLATQFLSRLRETLCIDLDLRDLFESPTIAGIAESIDKGGLAEKKSQVPPLGPIPQGIDLPLSFSQQRLWFLDQLEPGGSAYNLCGAVRFTGTLDTSALERSIGKIIKRHETLRTSMQSVDGTPKAVIAPVEPWTIEVHDFEHLPEGRRESETIAFITKEIKRPFDLSKGPLFRSILIRLGEDEHILVMEMHHIVSDGWSIGVFIQELGELYSAFSSGKTSPLPELPVQYVDFAHWQREWLQGEVLDTQLNYWKAQLGENPPVLQLPTDRPRPALQTYRGAKEYITLSEKLTHALKDLGQGEGTTLFMTLLAAFKILLHRYTKQEDLVVGTPVANRNLPEVEGLIGFFVSTLVFRSDLSGDPSFRNLLGSVREVSLGAFSHQDVPFEKLVEELRPERDMSYSPLFQAMFALQNMPFQPLDLPGLTMTPLNIDPGTSQFDLFLSMHEDGDKLMGTMEYSTDLFDRATIVRMLDHFKVLLEGVVSNPDQRLSELPLLTEAERDQHLLDWNDTYAEYPRDKCFHELFEAQVEGTPDSVAVVFEEGHLTYRELNTRANQVAAYLRTLGIGPNVLVGIYMERSLEMVIALLGILKAGGAYVPLDPDFPRDRLAFMLEDSGAPVLLTQTHLAENMSDYGGEIICFDSDWERLATGSEENPRPASGPESLAYVIYTSGSTGKPKGVQIPHGAFVNFLYSMGREPGMSSDDTVLSVTTISFDIFGLELFLPLLIGAKVVLAPKETAMDGARLMALLAKSRASVIQATPATYRLLLEAGWEGEGSLKILCGGEAFPPDLVAPLLDGCKEVWNLYGPTETTVWSTVEQIKSKEEQILIGRPIDNTQIYILDTNMQPVPIGVPGELHIGGDGLARGYLNRPELTEEKFIPHPFSEEPGARIYKTGDMARYRPDGRIECLGRIDHQVKVRGFRIELGEIETRLAEQHNVKKNVVITREDTPGDIRLVAYVVSENGDALQISDIRSNLKNALPDYMIPSAFVVLEDLPLTPNGKINRLALPAPETSPQDSDQEYSAPRTFLEKTITDLWAEVLNIERIGIHDNFFNLGGHSLLATKIISRVRNSEFPVDITVRQLFESPTIAGMAETVTLLMAAEEEMDEINQILDEIQGSSGS